VTSVDARRGVSSIPELEWTGNSGIGIAHLKKMELMKLELKFATRKLNPKINLQFFNSEIFLPWQSHLEYKLFGVGIPSRYSEYLLMVKKSR